MLILNTTTKSLEFLLGGSVTTTQLPFTTSYVDVTTTTYTPGELDGASNNAVAVTIAAAPGASTQRQIKLIDIYNADSVQATVTARYNNNGTTRILVKVTLDVASSLVYTDGEGWRVINASGQILGIGATGTTGPAGATGATGSTGATGAGVSRTVFPLGGSRESSLLASVATAVPSYLDVVLNGSLYAGFTIQARVDVRTTDAATSVTPRVQNITDASTAGTGSSSTGITEDYSGVNQSQTIALTLAAGLKTYRLQLTPGNADTDVFGIGVIELIAP